MARSYYHDFLDFAREEYDISYSEAQAVYRELKDEGFEPEDYYDIMVPEEVYEPEPEPVEVEPVEEEFEVDSFYDLPDMDYDWEDVAEMWLEEGEEIEIAPELVYEEGK